MNILVLTPYVPYPLNFGGAVRIYNLIRQLSRRHAVHLLTFREAGGGGDPAGLAPFCQTITTIPQVAADQRWQQLRALFSAQSFQGRCHYQPAMQAAILRLTREQAIDRIMVEFSQMAVYQFPAGVPLVLDEHNVEFDLLDRLAQQEEGGSIRRWYNRREAAKFRREELAACRAAAMTMVTSDRDGELLCRHAPELRPVRITNGVDCDYFVRPDGPRRPDSAVFVGATHYLPNDDGVMFFLQEMHARILAVCPGFRFTVVGGRPSPALKALHSDSVRVLGCVDDVRPHMWESAVFVVPLRLGGGTRFKVMEAMAAGVPVVSTRLGAEGMPAEDGRDLLLADTPEAFAEAVVQVLTDPALAARLAANGLAFVRRHFDWPVIGAELEAALARLA
jgi:glycosyltransferase involved in cell wall biosynthesis